MSTEDFECQQREDVTAAAAAPIIVVVHSSSKAKMTALKEHYRNNFPVKVVMALSVSQIVAGALSCILQVTCFYSLQSMDKKHVCF